MSSSDTGGPSAIPRSLSHHSNLPRLDSCDGLDTVEREGQFEGVRVRVYLWNKEEKVLFFKNYDLTANQICIEMAKKVLLQPESRNMFALWIVGNNLGQPTLILPFVRQCLPDQSLLSALSPLCVCEQSCS